MAAAGNAEETKARILAAALAEFSAYGIAGASVERIAKAAGCNKNLLYIYFDSKEKLFNTVLEQNLGRVYDALAFSPDDLPGYAGKVFDFGIDHPDLMRLLMWSVLEQQAGGVQVRRSSQERKIAALAALQQDGTVGDRFPPEFLLTVLMTVANAWTAAGPFGVALNPDAKENLDGIRAHVVSLVESMVSVDR